MTVEKNAFLRNEFLFLVTKLRGDEKGKWG